MKMSDQLKFIEENQLHAGTEKVKLFDALPDVVRKGMELAKSQQGKYGGLYVGRYYDKTKKLTTFVVLNDDDPEKVNDVEILDILCQCTPDKCWPIGHARNYIREDGSVKFEE